MSRKIIITCAVTGAIHTPSMSPHLPITAEQIADVIAEALDELDMRGIVGQDVTPFLLGRVVTSTGGRSLTANVALVRNNAAVAAQIAVAHAAIPRP